MELEEIFCYKMDNNITTTIKYSLQLANEHSYNMLTQCMGNYHGECSATCMGSHDGAQSDDIV